MTRIFQKNMFCLNRNKTAILTPTSNLASASTRLRIKKDRFWKKVCPSSFTCHLGDICTCFGAEQFWFPCRVIFENFAQTGLNWFLLILRTAKPKKGNYVAVPNIILCIYSSLTNVTLAASLKGKRKQLLVFHRGGIETFQKSLGAQHA